MRNIATSKWLATSTARMKMANMRANQDLGNTRDFCEHAGEVGISVVLANMQQKVGISVISANMQ